MAYMNLAHINLAMEHSAAGASLDRGPKPKWPLSLAIPFILAASAGLWVGLWKLGALLVPLLW
jgi:hypothetical protein